ncbi:hypothetical protein KFK09_024407 [Dendrobium nobile]|uniref:Uncharacterized protein n=1 Tax=Dendrobium nobile TaxID=94219 RepID=A0A8T3AJ88_DENNO|nr:hypothetical protein KFK09_024407 [Dendrobium nobile]
MANFSVVYIQISSRKNPNSVFSSLPPPIHAKHLLELFFAMNRSCTAYPSIPYVHLFEC